MKIIRLAIVSSWVVDVIWWILFKFSSLEGEIDAYIVPVGIYKQEENANEMINQLTNLKQPNYKYQKIITL
ncbi:MAG: hypothetical protein ACLRQF_23290 [Thomasclavelia ramosa]